MSIKYLDMFSGIGGFRSGLERIGGFECVGYCEIDEYARRAYETLYDTKGEMCFEDARTINPDMLPDVDVICGGFPCQSFSIAGKRRGFDDIRGTLFFEIARIAAVKKPALLFLENVPGLLSHDEGRTFATILSTLDNIGYDVWWQVLNSANFVVPQSRKRLFIIGYNREKSAGEVLAFTESNPKTLVKRISGSEGSRAYSAEGLSCTLTANGGGSGGKCGLYEIPDDKIHGCFCDMNEGTKITELCRCITARQNSGISNRKSEHSGVLMMSENPISIINPFKESTRQNGRRWKNSDDPAFTLTVTDRHGIIYMGGIRRLMPIECWRLQGFTDEQFNKVISAGISDTQLYKMAGNAVSVPVISAFGKQIKRILNKKQR